jgi:hypothetical protein
VIVDPVLMLYCHQIEMVMISFRIDIARKNDERMACDLINNLFLFAHPASKEQKKLEEVCDG